MLRKIGNHCILWCRNPSFVGRSFAGNNFQKRWFSCSIFPHQCNPVLLVNHKRDIREKRRSAKFNRKSVNWNHFPAFFEGAKISELVYQPRPPWSGQEKDKKFNQYLLMVKIQRTDRPIFKLFHYLLSFQWNENLNQEVFSKILVDWFSS